MKKNWCLVLAVCLVLGAALPAGAQGGRGVVAQGRVTDAQGQIVAGAEVRFVGHDTGARYSTKTMKTGDYEIIGMKADAYTVTVSKDGRLLGTVDCNVQFGSQATYSAAAGNSVCNIVLGKSATAPTVPLTAAQQQALEELKKLAAAAPKKNDKAVAEKVKTAQAAQLVEDWAKVLSVLTEVTQMDPMNDSAWGGIGYAYGKTGKFDLSVPALEKAVAIKPGFGPYHSGLALAYIKTGRTDDGIVELNSAAQVDSAKAATYYYSIGALLSDKDKLKEAIENFDKAIAADPKMADAYFWKGVDLMRQGEKKDDKMVYPAGTAEALKKYLELDPTGKHAGEAKQRLAMVGA